MRVKLQTTSLKETKAVEYAKRFVFGGAVTVVASLIDRHWGPVVGGLFLAFPGIFPPSASLVERHKVKREQDEGKRGVWSGRGQASVEAAGASAGALGLMAFAGVLWWGLPRHGAMASLLLALAAWSVVSASAWWVRDRM